MALSRGGKPERQPLETGRSLIVRKGSRPFISGFQASLSSHRISGFTADFRGFPQIFGKDDPKNYAFLGAAMEGHRALGPGFLEAEWRDSLALELARWHVPFERGICANPFHLRFISRRLSQARIQADGDATL